MKNFKPTSMSEWAKYVLTLYGENLRSKAIAANSFRFVQILQGEGFQAQDIEDIFKLFAARFRETGQVPPSDGYVNYQELVS